MMTLKGIDEKINMLHSTASKYIESLEIYNGYKLFLDKLYGKSPSSNFVASSKPQEEVDAMLEERAHAQKKRSQKDDGMQDLHARCFFRFLPSTCCCQTRSCRIFRGSHILLKLCHTSFSLAGF